MPLRHRPYRPKVKGCYECSQRRISCDRSAPHCTKCLSKGLECSGLNLRYRFTSSVSVRGKWAGRTVESFYPSSQRDSQLGNCQIKPNQGLQKQIPRTKTRVSFSGRKIQQGSTDLNSFGERRVLNLGSESVNAEIGGFTDDSFAILEYATGQDTSQCPDDHFNEYCSPPNLHPSSLPIFSRQPQDSSMRVSILSEDLLHDLPAWKRGLLLHYSNHIAPEMVAMDGPRNGWRHLVLPLAHTDELVMDAVLAASAFHQSIGNFRGSTQHHAATLEQRSVLSSASPQALYHRAIYGLQQRQNLAGEKYEGKQYILLTIIILLVVVMVNGCEDFPILFRMLQAATSIVGDDQLGGSELGDFVLRQVRKLRVYAAPLISEFTGLDMLSSQAQWEHLFDCLKYCSEKRADHAMAANFLVDIIQQAHDIYIQQAINGASDTSVQEELDRSVHRLERFKATLEAFPKSLPGQQTLIWATFMAASDSVLEEHKEYFKTKLLQHYSRSRFGNILKGIDHLPYIWAKRGEGVRWTNLWPQARVFIM